MKIVVLDGYTINPGDQTWQPLEELGQLTVYDRSRPEEVAARIGDAELVFANKALITREVIEACPNMRYIGVLATGYNNIDLAAAKDHGIPVCNVPGYGTDAVAQATMAMLLEIAHHTSLHDASVHAGDWTKAKDVCYTVAPIMELGGKTMGIIGYGSIGRRTGQLAQALGMKVLANRRHPGAPDGVAQMVDLDTLLSQSDVISLHCDLNETNYHLINDQTIAKMKDGVILLNLSRGPLVDGAALARALETGKVYWAGLDVLEKEPPQADEPLLTAPHCIITPHVAWAAQETRKRELDIAYDNVRAFLKGTPQNVVNQ